MRSTPLILIAATLAAPTAPAQAAVSDFRLPPSGSTRQPPPDRQGPIAPDVPESRRPAPTPSPAERSPDQAPAPLITPPPVIIPPAVTQTPAVAATRSAAVPARATAEPSPAPSAPAASEAPVAEVAQRPAMTAPPPAPATAVIDEGQTPPWLWALGGLLALSAAGLAGWSLARRRQAAGPRRGVPEVERPRVPPPGPPSLAPAAPAPSPPVNEPLLVTLEPLRLSLSLMNVTLSWRLQISNRGADPLTRLAVSADMISAHASMTREEQLSGPSDAIGPLRQIERLEPGESRMVEGEFRLPLGQIVPIRQGGVALLVPLARFRVDAEGARPLVRTFAIGQPGNGSGLQPFRLDQGPRVYPSLTQHAFAEVYPSAPAR